MEVALLSALASESVKILCKLVTSLVRSEYKKFKNVDKAFGKLETTILQAQELLSRVDLNLHHDCIRKAVEQRLNKLTRLCQEGEDLVNAIELRIARRHSGCGNTPAFIAIFRSSPLTCWVKAHGIPELQSKLDAVVEELKCLEGFRSPPAEPRTGLRNSVYCPNLGRPLIGRDNDIKEIVKELVSCPSKGVSIIGMHGLGKTALAQTILDHEDIVKYFDLRSWLIMSSDGFFNLKEIVDELVKNDILCKQLKTQLQDGESSGNNFVLNVPSYKRLLIALDDLVEVKDNDWDTFRSYLTSTRTGELTEIKILVTTLNPSVSKLIGTRDYYLKPLLDENCEAVIMEKALLDNENLSKSRISNIAHALATRCEGLPLVARMLGFVLARCDEGEQFTILRKDLWDVVSFREQVLPILEMSYQNMPQNLKDCLAYFSLFPQNYCFNIDFVHLWIAEGFIQQPQGTSSLENTCKDCFATFSRRSIIQFSDDEKKSCHLNKFSYKFAQLAGAMTCIQLDDQGLSTSSSKDINPRHLSLLYCQIISPQMLAKIKKFKRLRTFLALHNEFLFQNGKILTQLLKPLAYLRVLVLKGTNVLMLPDSVYRLQLLRYLDISSTPIKKLPETLSKLRTLKFLKLKDTKLTLWPKDLRSLTNLLDLDCDMSDIRRCGLPSHIGDICSLWSLPLFPVENKKGYHITELQNMNCLEGPICITKLENVKDGTQAEMAKLSRKTYLTRLELQWTASKRKQVDKDVLLGLKPHDHLKELKITNYGFDGLPGWIQLLPLLQKIHLQGCEFCNVLPLGQLTNLKTLVLEEMKSLKSIDRGFCGPLTGSMGCFTSLESLVLRDLALLQEWKGLEEMDMLHLRDLKIVDCPVLVNLPSFNHCSSLEDLQIKRCGALQLLPELPSSLKSVTIRESDLLRARCDQVSGEDWPKVDHVPKVEIDDMEIQTSGANVCVPAPSYYQQAGNIIYQGYELVRDYTGAILGGRRF